MSFQKQHLTNLIKLALQHKASDIHIRTDENPCLRLRGELLPIQSKPFEASVLHDIAKILLDDPSINTKDINELDGAYGIEGLCRLRYNIFQYDQKLGIILRIVSSQIPTLESLGFPEVLKDISLQRRGLVLVTGPTGSGKSTTLASMIDHINANRNAHIITIEDPVEFLHPQKNSRVSQRELGRDTQNFDSALRSALRQDPDVILIGEMRDPTTVQTALKAAETGHTVFSTVHTTNAMATIGKIISMFPPEEQADVRKRLALNLHATIGQRMLKSIDGDNIVIAMEIMLSSPGVREVIQGEQPLERLQEIIQDNYGEGGNGSQSFDQNIMRLYEEQIISKETALQAVSSQSDFLQKLDFD